MAARYKRRCNNDVELRGCARHLGSMRASQLTFKIAVTGMVDRRGTIRRVILCHSHRRCGCAACQRTGTLAITLQMAPGLCMGVLMSSPPQRSTFMLGCGAYA